MNEPRLLDLQAIDSDIDHLQKRKAELEAGAEIEAARDRAAQAEQVVGELRLALDELSTNQKRLEYDDDAMGQKLAAEKARMYDGSIMNTRELSALEAEIKNLGERIGRIEDEVLELMVQREELEEKIAEAEQALTAARQEHERVGGGAVTELGQVEEQLTSKVAERGTLAAAIDEELVELYDDLRGAKHGIGAAALTDGVCQGCHEKLSPLDLDKLKKTEGVKRCPTCRRILVT
ncbi:MAG: C4-type zinc ribbon domain-containing protein [Actinomycetota bacterium]